MKRLLVFIMLMFCVFTFAGCSANATNRSEQKTSNNQQEKMCIIDIAASERLAAAVYSDGTVVVTGPNANTVEKEVSQWRNIVSIALGDEHIVGLKNDGSVISAGSNKHGQCNVSTWKNVKQISASKYSTTALKKDGTIYTTGDVMEIYLSNGKYQSRMVSQDFSKTRNAIKISSGSTGCLILHYDKKCSTVGVNVDGAYRTVPQWEGVVDIAQGFTHCLGLKEDGTILVSGINYGKSDIHGWKNIVQIAAGKGHSVGLKSNGTVVATGTAKACQTQNWINITKICAGGSLTLGLTESGTVVYSGDLFFEEPNVELWNTRVK